MRSAIKICTSRRPRVIIKMLIEVTPDLMIAKCSVNDVSETNHRSHLQRFAAVS